MVLCGKSENEMSAMVGYFSEECRRRYLNVNVGKSKGMVLHVEKGLECEVYVDGIRLGQVS